MKLKANTIILVVVTALLGSFVYFQEIKQQSTTEKLSNEGQEQRIFSFEIDDIQSLTLETEQRTLEFVKTGERMQPWQMIAPEKVTASEPSISFLLNLLVEAKPTQEISLNPKQLDEYGLVQPSAKITVKLKNQETYQLNLGNANFDNTLIYAQLVPQEPEEGQTKILLVSKSFHYAVERDFEDWKESAGDLEKGQGNPSRD